jgi:hypothetical protein
LSGTVSYMIISGVGNESHDIRRCNDARWSPQAPVVAVPIVDDRVGAEAKLDALFNRIRGSGW